MSPPSGPPGRDPSRIPADPALLAGIVEAAAVGIALAGPDGRWLYANPALCALLGRRLDECVALRLEDVVHPDEARAVGGALAHLLEGEAVAWSLPQRLLRRDGGLVHGVATASALGGSGDTQRRYLVQFMPDGRPAPDRAVAASIEQRSGVALESAGQWMWDWNIATNEVWRSPQWKRTLGLEEDEIAGSDVGWRLVHPDDREGIDAAVARVATSEDAVFDATYRLRHKDGRWLWILSRGRVVARDVDGAPLRLLATSTDISRQKEVERDLEAANERLERQAEAMRELAEAAQQGSRAKSEFLAMMSHEIRTPMTGVLGMADLLASSELDAGQRDYVRAIQGSGQHLLSIINDILDVSRLEAGRLRLERIDFPLFQVLEQVRSLLAPQAIEQGLQLDIEHDGDLPPVVRGDPTRLRQILVNLVANGLKFTAHGRVGVRVGRAAGDRLRFEVQDSGIGIAEARQAQLFAPFAQGDSSTTRRFGGSGLGLAICRQLVEAMGGEIGFESVEGIGSTFWFEAPFEVGDSGSAVEHAGLDAAPARPLHLLVAEDVAVNRDLLRAMLERHGHRTRFAENGAEALELAAGTAFDMVLMDVQMPVMDGIEATRRIRALPPPHGGVPIIALTANVMEAERRRCLDAGMDRVLTKPVVWPELFAALAAVAETVPAPEPETGPPVGEPLLDEALIAVLEEGMGAQSLATFLNEALAEAERGWRVIEAAKGELATARPNAHRLRGTAGSFGLLRISVLAGRIEDGLLAGSDVTALAHDLGEAVVATREAMARRAG